VLGVVLEKVNEYRIGEGELPGYNDLLTAIKLAEAASALVLLVTASCLAVVSSLKLGLLGSLI